MTQKLLTVRSPQLQRCLLHRDFQDRLLAPGAQKGDTLFAVKCRPRSGP